MLRETAKQAALQRRLRPAPEPEPTELQEKAARDLGDLLGEDVDPLAMHEDSGMQGPYYVVRATVDVVEFKGHYLWGGRDQRHHLAGFWKARRASVPRRWWRRLFWWRRDKLGWRAVCDLADVGELL